MADLAGFRLAFPAFDDLAPDPVVQFQLDIAAKRLNADRWGSLFDYGSYLYAAHHLAIRAQENAAAARGAIPGMRGGLMTAKSVDSVSVNYDVTQVSNEGAGYWNQTSYGREFWAMARMMGVGPVQIGVPSPEDAVAVQAWPGPASYYGY